MGRRDVVTEFEAAIGERSGGGGERRTGWYNRPGRAPPAGTEYNDAGISDFKKREESDRSAAGSTREAAP